MDASSFLPLVWGFVIPFIVLLVIQFIRWLAEVPRSGGADIIAVFLLFDVSLMLTPNTYKMIVRPWLNSYLAYWGFGLFVLALILLGISIRVGERAIHAASVDATKSARWAYFLNWALAAFVFLPHYFLFSFSH